MNVIRGIFSIGVTIGCLLNWVDIGVIQVSGINWGPSIFLLFASLLTSGYAFYNSYNNTNQNTWVYLITGLLGIGVCIFAYVFVKEKLGYVDRFLDTDLKDILFNSVGIGYYVTGLSSILLFFTGFDKSDSNDQSTYEVNTSLTQTPTPSDNSPIQKWLNENPGKSLNDYFGKHK